MKINPHILRSPDDEDGAAVLDADTTNQAGAADGVQGAGASADDASAPAPNDTGREADDVFADAIAKAKGEQQEPEAQEDADMLGDDEVAELAAAISTPPATDKTAPEPKPESKPDAKDQAEPEADEPEAKKQDEPPAVTDDDVAAAFKSEFAELEDFSETRSLVKGLLEIRAENRRLRDEMKRIASARQEQHAPSADHAKRVDELMRAIDGIGGIDKEVFGDFGGKKLTPEQLDARVALDAKAKAMYDILAAREDTKGKSRDELAEIDALLTRRALDAAHRVMVKEIAEKKAAAKQRSEPAAAVVNRMRQVAATRSPAAMGSGRRQKDIEITPEDDGPTVIGKILAKHGLRK